VSAPGLLWQPLDFSPFSGHPLGTIGYSASPLPEGFIANGYRALDQLR
jgi:hypothetical protein